MTRVTLIPQVLACAGVLTALPAHRACADDVTVLKSRFYTSFLSEGAPSQSTIQNDLATIQADGSWADINYSDRSRNVWPPADHLYRIEGMARAYRTVGHFYHNQASVRTACSNAMNFWFAARPSSDNWWWNEIGANLTLMKSLVLLEAELTAGQLSSGCALLAQADMSGQTGQNLVWEARITAVRGALQNSVPTVTAAMNAITSTIVITTAEGIQPDYSFQQHDETLYSGGYGAGFSADTSCFANLARGTQWAFAAPQIDIISNLLLEGQRWMTRGRMFDYGVHGRGITRKGITAAEIIPANGWMAELQTARQAEFTAFQQQLALATPPTQPAVTGNRHFWHSDFMSHSRPGYYMSTRMYSVRNYNTDGNSDGTPINGEGKRSHHIADGCTFIFRDGEEYDHIFGVWDWYRIPGTTVEYGSSLGNPVRYKSSRTFVGGVSDGTYGAAAFDHARGTLSARKSWFYFDREVVCLGTAITNSSANPTQTTLNQCLLRGPVTVRDSQGTRSLVDGDWTLSGLQWAHHDGVGYVLPASSTLRLKNGVQSGEWHDINDLYPAGEVDSRNVFMLWIDHGPAVSGADYAYIVVPDISATALASYASALPVQVAANTSAIQAAEHASLGICGAAFYQAGSVTTPAGLTLAVTQPCLVLARAMGGEFELSVANPNNQPLSLTLDINRYLTGPGTTWMPGSLATRVAFSLPSGHDAGRSVVRLFSLPSASAPLPAHQSASVDPRTVLAWTSGEGAAGHHVYLGTDAAAVTNATPTSSEFHGTLPAAATSYDPPGLLAQNMTYHWRIDEIPPVGPPVRGPTWSFTTLRVPGDFDDDLDVDQSDFGAFQRCLSAEEVPYPPGCDEADLNGDDDVDAGDLAAFLGCLGGAGKPPGC